MEVDEYRQVARIPRFESPVQSTWFSIGGVRVQLSGSRPEDVNLVPSLAPFRAESGSSDIDVTIAWVSSICPKEGRRIFDSGGNWCLYEDDFGFHFHVSSPALGRLPYKRLSIDARFCKATLQLSEESHAILPCGPQGLDYPLDELLIMHRLAHEKAIELHGTGIIRTNREANLFVGHSGAGKSTTTRLWAAVEDVEVLSDDRIIVRHDPSSPTRIRMYGTPWHGEGMYASPNNAPLSRIFVLEHGYGNVIARLTPSQAVAELFARSFVPFHRHEYVDSALAFLQELVDSVPVYRYDFEPDERAVDKILHFHD